MEEGRIWKVTGWLKMEIDRSGRSRWKIWWKVAMDWVGMDRDGRRSVMAGKLGRVLEDGWNRSGAMVFLIMREEDDFGFEGGGRKVLMDWLRREDRIDFRGNRMRRLTSVGWEEEVEGMTSDGDQDLEDRRLIFLALRRV